MSASSPLLSLSALPKAGARIDLPPLAGSSDALALAEIAVGNAGKLLAVVTANAADAQRLLDEIPWFAPNLRVRLLPDWETLPYDTFSPHQDLVSERLATLWAATQGELDILLVPASTAVYRLAPPAFLAAYTFAFKKGETLDAEKFRSQVTLAGYAHVTQVVSPGEYSIRGRADRPLPDGFATALPARPVRRRDREHQDLRRRYPAHRLPGAGTSACCRPVNSRWMTRDAHISARPSARLSRATRPSRASTRIFPRGIASAGIEYYLPLFFDETATVFDYLAAGCGVRDPR